MKPQKYLKSYKCDCFQPNNYCNCSDRIPSSELFIENVIDVAKTLVEVMNLCAVYGENTKALTDVITYYFLHFEEIIHRIDSVHRKRLNKEDLMNDLGRKCFMNRVEAQMAYSIIKRAFKAFYYGTGLGGVPYIPFKDKLTHTSECLWAHAAQRTAQIYASYKGIFYVFQKDLECKIKLLFRQLHNRLSKRSVPHHDDECMCVNCMKRIVKETLKKVTVTTELHAVDDPYEAAYLKEQEKVVGNQADENCDDVLESANGTSKKEKTCNCSSLSMSKRDYIHITNAESVQSNSSRDPFHCRWMPLSKQEYEIDEAHIDIKVPEEFVCFSCHSDIEDDTVYECTREDCSCKAESEVDCEGVETEKEFSAEEVLTPSDISNLSDKDIKAIFLK